MGERSPHTHDTSMERKERKEHGGKEGKNNGEERKRKMPRLSSLLPSWRAYLKSRNHDILKELDGNYSIIEGASLMSR